MSESKEIEKIKLFYPKDSQDLRKHYPELSRIDVFHRDKISKEDLLFVWYVSNPSSPLIKEYESLSKRVRQAIKIVWPDDQQNDKFTKWREGNFPSYIRAAMARMDAFKDDVRFTAKSMMAKIFVNLQSLSDVKEENFIKVEMDDEGTQIKSIDWAGRKAYIDSCDKIMDMLPKTIQVLEEGFGIDEKVEELTRKAIDRHHDSKD